MATQTFNLLGNSYVGRVPIADGYTKGWTFSGTSVDDNLSSVNDNDLSLVYIDRVGTGDQDTAPYTYTTYFIFDDDLSATFESNGSFTLAVGADSVEVSAAASTGAGRYLIEAASLQTLYDALPDARTATAATFTINDNAGTDTTPPTISGTPSTNTAGTVITIGFDEALDAGSEPAASAFTTSPSKTISDVSISGSDLLLTVAPAFVNGDTITVSYTAPNANPLQDATGNDVANFSAQSVTNNVPAGPAALAATITGPASVQVGDTPQFSVTVTGGTGTISRQWQYRYRGTGAWTNGGTGTSYTLPAIPANQANQTLEVRCNVDRGTANVTSNVISRQVGATAPPPPPPVTGGVWPTSGTLQIQPAGIAAPVNFASHEDDAADVDRTGEWNVEESGNLGAIASAVETLETKVENIEDLEGNTVVSSLARWTVKTQIGDLVGGVGLLNDGTAVRFYIAADRFAIIPPGSQNIDNARLPFVVSEGQVFINSAVIANASIGTAKIQDAFLTNLTAAHGTLALARIEKASIFDLAIGNAIQSDDYSAVGENVVARAASLVLEGITFVHDTEGTAGNGYNVGIVSERGSGAAITAAVVSGDLLITLRDEATSGFVNFGRADIATAVNASAAPVTASGTGNLSADFNFAFSVSITGPATVTAGTSPSFSVTTQGAVGAVSRRWQYRYGRSGGWTDGGTGTTYSVPTVPFSRGGDDLEVRCNVSQRQSTVTSNVILRRVQAGTLPSAVSVTSSETWTRPSSWAGVSMASIVATGASGGGGGGGGGGPGEVGGFGTGTPGSGGTGYNGSFSGGAGLGNRGNTANGGGGRGGTNGNGSRGLTPPSFWGGGGGGGGSGGQGGSTTVTYSSTTITASGGLGGGGGGGAGSGAGGASASFTSASSGSGGNGGGTGGSGGSGSSSTDGNYDGNNGGSGGRGAAGSITTRTVNISAINSLSITIGSGGNGGRGGSGGVDGSNRGSSGRNGSAGSDGSVTITPIS